ncbi:MAG: HTTM domain-containing protein [Pseudobdellovibrionaceae bacterium]
MIQNILQRWNDFWFGPVGLLNLAVFRIIFAGTLFVIYLSRQWDVVLFYTDQGILPKALSHQILALGFRPPFQLVFWPDSWVFGMHAIFVLSLLLICLGVFSRFFGVIATYLHLAFLFRNYGVAFGVDQITSFFLIYLTFTRADAKLSLRAWWRDRMRLPALETDTLTSVFYRMLQVQLCLIYVYSGMEKLKGQSWWDGTAVWSVLANSQMVIADLTWTRHVPFLIVLISFATILFEIYFPVLVWVPALRRYCLVAGMLFHAGIGIVMALWSFAIVMISPYCLFIPEAQLKSWLQSLKNRYKLPIQL